MQTVGLYIHVPFCASKCAYCDFYSFPGSEEAMDAYTGAVLRELEAWGAPSELQADTVYFGGGTPSLLGGARLTRILERAACRFSLPAGAEVTLEANPADHLGPTLEAVCRAGVNRLSLGVQSGVPAELETLGRRHSLSDVARTAEDAARAGIGNLSMDLMLAVPGQTMESLLASLRFLTGFSPDHISAYLLKIEEGTPFFHRRENLILPNEDEAADFYLAAVRELERRGWRQYEISNFARPGKESRHNLKYWNAEPYLGLGPAAHSFLNGHRFYYPRDIKAYITGGPDRDGVLQKLFPDTADPAPVPPLYEGPGGDPAEYAMLRFRLTEGLNFEKFAARYGRPPAAELLRRAERFIRAGYMRADGKRLSFTARGFLLSNPILADLLEEV